MKNFIETVREQGRLMVRSLYGRRWMAITVTTVVSIIAGVAVSFAPNRYEAKAQIYVDTQKMLKPLMSGLTYQPDVDQQVRMLARTLISRPNVQRLLNSPDLQFTHDEARDKEDLINRLMTRIKVIPASGDNYNFYEISYRGDSAENAKGLVNATVNLFLQSGANEKQRDSEDAGHFIEEQIRDYEKKLTDAENRVKEFKIKNFGASGVSSQDYFTRVSVLSEEVAKITTELKAAEKARDTYKMSLSGNGPDSIIDGMASTAVAELENRLEAQQKRLDDLLQRFTESHPEVINARRLVVQLIDELKTIEQDAVSGKSSNSGVRRTATNPVYQRLKLQMVETEAQVASLRSQLATKQSILEQARSVGDRMPQVEAELAQLNRDYDVIRKNYDALVSRREAASLGMKLSENSQLAEFRIVEPVKVSSSPVFPSRFHLSLIAVFVAILAGIGSTILADSLHPTVHSADALRRLSGRPVLGAISLQISPRHVQIQRAELRRLTMALATLMVIQAAWVVWVAAYQ